MTKQTSDHKAPLQGVRPIYILAAAGVGAVFCISALRSNNLHMVKLREQVYVADKNNGNVSAALTELQRYVTSHMNTDLTPGNHAVYPPIQLKYTYQRLQEQAAAGSDNSQIYADAQAYCEQQNSTDFSGRNRVPCIQEYVKSHGASVPQAIPDSLYKFDFLSPRWSADAAGWSMIVTALLLLATIALFAIQQLTRFRRSHK